MESSSTPSQGLPKPSSSPHAAANATGIGRVLLVFQSPGYGWLWGNFLFFWGGMSLSGIANGWLMMELTDSAFWVGLMAGVSGAVTVVFGLFTGALADRFDRRKLLMAGQAANALIALVIGLLDRFEAIDVSLLLLCVAFQALSGVVQTPARNTLVADLVPRERLVNANAANFLALGIIRIPFAIAGGLIIQFLGISACYFLIVGTLLLAVALLFRLPTPSRAVPMSAPLLRTIAEGLRYSLRRGPIRSLLLLSTTTEGFGYSHAHMLPIMAKKVLNVGSSGYGELVAATAAGQLVVNLFLASRRDIQSKGWMTIGATLGYGLFLLLFAVSTSFPLSLAFLFVAGGFGIAYDVGLVTLLQSTVPDQYRGRVMGVYTQTLGANTLGGFQAGAVASAVSAPFAIGLGGSLVMANALRLTRLARQLNGTQPGGA
ncbi:MAG: MFS transporter [Dehalococcoidia bacterium]|nr:MFS transporter [Dehalococcoidia bacterium]